MCPTNKLWYNEYPTKELVHINVPLVLSIITDWFLQTQSTVSLDLIEHTIYNV